MRTFASSASPLAHSPADTEAAADASSHVPAPRALFITCSDSRVVPTLLTGTAPGELHELRTAGHVVPRYRSDAHCGIAATLEFALGTLHIADVILCGHTDCSALRTLQDDPPSSELPLARNWFARAAHRPGPEQRATGTTASRTPEQRHLLAQLHHLRTYPCVTRRLVTRRLRVHAWQYDDRTGRTLGWDATARTFRPLRPALPAATATAAL
ncbi:carbonic anhydrase [Streptomyces sp. CB02959]|uniref:carbonic anhydrase n=1 Tax=Streptomyces sp. CB02959 TaxID=2020330 RepID=UPI000C27D2EB|nr:carbonic anhydrase [Streptomyces sp. CB02959]PJN38669.1 carbonic anhydrase [Streptomyces sp. CB02959]